MSATGWFLLLSLAQVVLADTLFNLVFAKLAAVERMPEGAHKEEDDSRGPDVALRANVSDTTLDLLRRLVAE